MKPTDIYTVNIPANSSFRLLVTGEYFKIMSATGPVRVTSKWGRLTGMIAGQGLEDTPFDYLYFEDMSGAPNTLKVIIGDRKFIDGINGTIDVTNAVTVGAMPAVNIATTTVARANFSNVQKTVTNASAQLVAAKAARSYLLVQNNDPTGSIYLGFGVAATVAAGLRIIPGGAFELPTVLTTQAINAIGSIASNANIVVVEG